MNITLTVSKTSNFAIANFSRGIDWANGSLVKQDHLFECDLQNVHYVTTIDPLKDNIANLLLHTFHYNICEVTCKLFSQASTEFTASSSNRSIRVNATLQMDT